VEQYIYKASQNTQTLQNASLKKTLQFRGAYYLFRKILTTLTHLIAYFQTIVHKIMVELSFFMIIQYIQTHQIVFLTKTKQ
jgi:hypothetical protein